MESYKGSKGGEGVYQRIINLVPPHRIWWEIFAGSAIVTKMIRAAEQSFVTEAEPLQAGRLKKELKDRAVVYNCAGSQKIDEICSGGVDTFIFADPPYLKETRTYQRDIYKVEWSRDDHWKWIQWCKSRGERIMITHPICDMYMIELKGWNRVTYTYNSRQGLRDNCIWMNYEKPEELHDYRYCGHNKTERQRIQRKIERELSKLSTLKAIERNAIIQAIVDKYK